MKLALLAVLLISVSASAKNVIDVDVKAVHQATHEARDTRALVEKGLMGSTAPSRSVEVFDLDTIVNKEHVVLTCEDDKGCEAPALGIHKGELLHRGHVRLTFDLPVTHKEVSRRYKISGSW